MNKRIALSNHYPVIHASNTREENPQVKIAKKTNFMTISSKNSIFAGMRTECEPHLSAQSVMTASRFDLCLCDNNCEVR